jgi:UDP-N-acetyl-D-mannosaminuronate dehydrogenase
MTLPGLGAQSEALVLKNVPDIRNSRVIDVVRELQSFGVAVQIVDPLADPRNVGGIWRRNIRHRRA